MTFKLELQRQNSIAEDAVEIPSADELIEQLCEILKAGTVPEDLSPLRHQDSLAKEFVSRLELVSGDTDCIAASRDQLLSWLEDSESLRRIVVEVIRHHTQRIEAMQQARQAELVFAWESIYSGTELY